MSLVPDAAHDGSSGDGSLIGVPGPSNSGIHRSETSATLGTVGNGPVYSTDEAWSQQNLLSLGKY